MAAPWDSPKLVLVGFSFSVYAKPCGYAIKFLTGTFSYHHHITNAIHKHFVYRYILIVRVILLEREAKRDKSDGRKTGMRRSAATRIVKTLEGRLKIDLCKPTSKKNTI